MVEKTVIWNPQLCICLSLGSLKADSKARVWVHCSIWEMISRSMMREWGSETREGKKPQNGRVDEQSQLEQVEPNSTGMPQKECAENPSGCPAGARKLRYLSPSSPLSLFESCSGDGSSPAGLACSPSQRMALCRETTPNSVQELSAGDLKGGPMGYTGAPITSTTTPSSPMAPQAVWGCCFSSSSSSKPCEEP